MTQEKLTPQPLKTSSIALTGQEADLFTLLVQETSDQLGRSMSGSAIVRAVLRLARQHTMPFTALVAAVEQEVTSGRKWEQDSPHRPCSLFCVL